VSGTLLLHRQDRAFDRSPRRCSATRGRATGWSGGGPTTRGATVR